MTLAANDQRIGSVLGWTSATSPFATPETSQAMLGRIAPRPVMWAVGGPADIAHRPAMVDWANVPATMPAYQALHASRDHAGMGFNVDADRLARWFKMTLSKRKRRDAICSANHLGAVPRASPAIGRSAPKTGRRSERQKPSWVLETDLYFSLPRPTPARGRLCDDRSQVTDAGDAHPYYLTVSVTVFPLRRL
jgi:hypothetical protein